MSTIATTNIKHASSSSNNIVLNSDGSTTIASGAGKILQIVEGSTSTQVNTSAGTWVATNLTASITPASTSNKVFVAACVSTWQSVVDNALYVTIFRSTDGGSNWTNLGHDNGSNQGGGMGYSYVMNARIAAIHTLNILDSPSSVSPAVQYKVYFRTYNTSGNATSPAGDETSRIHLLEVSG